MDKYKTFEELKEELGNKFEEYMYKANIELLEKRDKAILYILNNFCCDKRCKYTSEDIYKIIGILTGE